jgi:hypothetical protein
MIDLLKRKKLNGEDSDEEVKPEGENNEKKPLSSEERAKKELKELERYRDLEGMTLSKLNLGLWWVQNRLLIFKIVKIILIVISVITWSLFIFTFGEYLLFGMNKDNKMISDIANGPSISHDIFAMVSAQDLRVQTVKKFNTLSGRYDFLAEVDNPNQKFAAYFEYYFSVDGKDYGRRTGFILPQETKYFFALGQEISSAPSSVEFRMDNFTWQRIDSRRYPDWENFKNDRLQITTANVNFTPARSTVLSEKLDLNELKFDLSNNSIFNYWEVNLKILLHSHGDIVGVNEYKATSLMSGETRTIVISWPGHFGSIDDITIIPEIDITDKKNYINYDEGVGEVK